MKRQAAKQMRREDGDDDDEEAQDVSAQVVAPSPATEGRKIRGLPKRRIAGSPAVEGSPATPSFSFGAATPQASPIPAGSTPTSSFGSPAQPQKAEGEAAKPANPFAAFGGFGKAASTSTAALVAAPKVASPSFSFGGSGNTPSSFSTTPTKPPSSTSSFLSNVVASTSSPAADSASPTTMQTTPSGEKDRYTSLRGLNVSIQKALASQLEKRLKEDAFVDLSKLLKEAESQYSKHRGEIEAKAKTATGKSGVEVNGSNTTALTGTNKIETERKPATTTATAFAFTPVSAPAFGASTSNTTPAAPFTSSTLSSKKEEEKEGSITSSAPPKSNLPSGGFTFGGKAVSSAPSTSPSASSTLQGCGPKFDIPKGGFSFAGMKPVSSTPAKDQNAETEEEESKSKPSNASGSFIWNFQSTHHLHWIHVWFIYTFLFTIIIIIIIRWKRTVNGNGTTRLWFYDDNSIR